MYQEQYWNEMVEIRAHQNYLMLYQLSSERWDLGFKIFLALASSGAISAWAVWQQYPKVWATIIAASQVISVLSNLMPHKTRIKPLGAAALAIGELADKAERGWFDVAEGALSDKQINKARHDLKEQKRKIMTDKFGSMVIPVRKRRMTNASAQAAEYFTSHYGV
ncbi:hypothetical protein MXL15_25790 [Pseudomonas mosselii]|uniref:hypothetical protein n=1 Tax=Pseudomonas mosselii TaxID=78327 RepID=UPI002DB87548|nr:hypothetical protein [Pseudomonas mosselii]MEB5935603.1 hypothetical protein [Pseudomonas mosselii]